MNQFCSSAELQTLATSANPATIMMTLTAADAPLSHTTSSMPANLHLGATIPESTAITAMILRPGIATDAFTAILDGGSSFCIILCACLFLPSFAGGGSSNPVPILAAESSSCYATTVMSVNGHQELNNLMPIEKLPPGPQFFVPPESDPSIWELSGLMDLS
ncbi:hypothetical protein Aperf_G00000016841 [Anoplocephala perfoliata]